MKKLYTVKRESVYWNLAFSSFIPGICSILILSAVFLPLLIRAARENDSAHERNILYSVDSFFENLHTNAEDITNQIEKSEWIHDVYIDQIINGKPFPYDMKKIILSDLTLCIARFNYVSSVSVRYYDNQSILFTNKGVFDNLEYYQENFPEKMYYFFFPGEVSSEFISVDFNGRNYLVYSVPITDIEGGRAKGEINIVYDTDRIGKHLHLIAENNVSGVQILNQNGEAVWEYRLAEAKGTATLSDDLGLRIRIDIPKAVHIQNKRRIMPYIILTFVIDLAACAFLTYIFSKRNYRPVEMILKKFQVNDSGRKNEFESLSYMLDQILMKKSEAEVFLERLTPLARQKVINSLLNNPAFFSSAHVMEQMKDLKIEFPYSRINVAAIQIPFSRMKMKERGNLNQAAELAIQTIAEQMCEGLELISYIHQEDIDRYKIILNYHQEEVLSAFLEQFLESGNQYIHNEKIEDSMYVGTGSEVRSCSEIYQASEQADKVINYCIINHSAGTMSYSEIRSRIDNHYSYSLSDEILLTHAVMEGNAEAAKKVLEKIVGEVSGHQLQSVTSLQLLFSNLLFTVMRSAESIGVTVAADVPVDKWEKNPVTLSAIEQIMKEKISEICSQVEKLRQNLTANEEDEIMEYIDQHIYDPDLSLNYIADRYHKSAAYISMLFKNKKSMNYTDYVNRTRINRAVELLTNAHMDIDAVCRQVGYISMSTFRRNFVKYMKQNPGEFVSSKEI